MLILRSTALYVIDPPCRDDLSFGQKILRILGVTVIVVGGCILGAFVLAVLLFTCQAL